MSKYLTIGQVQELATNNSYEIPAEKYRSRCFSGNFINNTELPALALPGGDIGEIAVLYSASNEYGFECNLKSSVNILKEVVAKSKNSKYKQVFSISAKDCKYLHFLSEDPEKYSLSKEMIKDIFSYIEQPKLQENPFKSEKKGMIEKSCLIVQGNKGILPQYTFKDYTQTFDASVFVYHKSLVNERRKVFIKDLVRHKAVKLNDGLHEEYLYEILSDMAEFHLFTFLTQIDLHIPIYSVEILPNNKIKVESYS